MQLNKIPTTVVTGFLGSGKTTLLSNVLKQAAGKRIAVIVNELASWISILSCCAPARWSVKRKARLRSNLQKVSTNWPTAVFAALLKKSFCQ